MWQRNVHCRWQCELRRNFRIFFLLFFLFRVYWMCWRFTCDQNIVFFGDEIVLGSLLAGNVSSEWRFTNKAFRYVGTTDAHIQRGNVYVIHDDDDCLTANRWLYARPLSERVCVCDRLCLSRRQYSSNRVCARVWVRTCWTRHITWTFSVARVFCLLPFAVTRDETYCYTFPLHNCAFCGMFTNIAPETHGIRFTRRMIARMSRAPNVPHRILFTIIRSTLATTHSTDSILFIYFFFDDSESVQKKNKKKCIFFRGSIWQNV